MFWYEDWSLLFYKVRLQSYWLKIFGSSFFYPFLWVTIYKKGVNT